MAMSDKGGEDMDDSESLDDLFCEIWERESKPELRFDVVGAGTVRCYYTAVGDYS